MHAMNENGRLMAQWRTTGGAIEAQAFEAAGDDGLAAVQFTVASGGGICTDDGLAAMQFTTDMHPYARCSGDDGLEAGGRLTNTGRLSCGQDCADDGLQGGGRGTRSAWNLFCGGDDGLKAGSVTGMHIPGVCGDDGLSATAFSVNRVCRAPTL